MHISLKKKGLKINIYLIAIILLLAYFELGEIIKIVYFHSAIVLVSLLLGTAIFISRMGKCTLTKYDLMWFGAVFLFVVLRNGYLKIGEFDNNIFYYFLLVVLMVCMKNNTSWIKCFIDFIYWVSLLHAVVTILFAYAPSLYEWYASHFLSSVYYQEVMEKYASGTIAGLCVNYGVNACLIAIGTGMAVIKFLWPPENQKRKWTMLIPIAIRAIGLMFTGKRSPILFMLAAVVIIYVIIERRKTMRKITKAAMIVVAAIILVYIGSMFVPQLQVLLNRLLDSDDWTTLGGRTMLYEIAVDMFKSSPIFGHGWDSYMLTFETVVSDYGNYSRMLAHNIYLQMLAEVGIVGFVWILGLFLYPLGAVFSKTRKYGLNQFLDLEYSKEYPGMTHPESSIIVSCIFIIIFFLFYGMTGNPLYDPYIYFLAIISCAALQSYLVRFKRAKSAQRM